MTREQFMQKLEILLAPLSREERDILLAGCLMNWYAERRAKHG